MKQIIVHHSASGPTTTLEDINNWHRQRNFPKSSLGYYVGYHYVITATGNIHQTRKETEVGVHTRGHNSNIGICMIGRFEEEAPKKEQLKTLWSLLDILQEKHKGGVTFHSDYGNTACPGKYLKTKVGIYTTINSIKNMIKKIKTKIGYGGNTKTIQTTKDTEEGR